MTVEPMFQGQLEGAKSLYLADDKEVVVEEGINGRVARTVERHLNLIWRKVGQGDARECQMMIWESDRTNKTIFDNTQIGKAWIRLQNAVDGFEGHFIDPMLKQVEDWNARSGHLFHPAR